MKKFDRVISTLVLLQTKKIINATTISERFGISLRTVYRDINTLKNAGIPIIGDPGIGYSIMDGYRIPPIMFNEGEAAALLTAEKFIGRLTDAETLAYYSSAMMKIKAILKSNEKQSLAALDDSIVFSDQNSWESQAYLQQAFKSIANKSILSLQYQKADGTQSTRDLEPIGCYHNFNNWYLVAYCRLKKDYRTFKTNRILSLTVLDTHFERQHLSLQDYIDQQDAAWKEEQQLHTIEIAFNKSLIEFAEKRKYYFGFVNQKNENDVVHMKFVNSSIEIFSRWLIQFGDQASVIAPIELKDLLKTMVTNLHEHYK